MPVKARYTDFSSQVIIKVKVVEDLGAKGIAHMVKRNAIINVETGPKFLPYNVVVPGGGIIDTGALMGAFHVQHVGAGEYRVYNDVPYFGYVEEGTFKMPARPTLKPAVRQTRKSVASEMRASWKKIFG